MAWWRAVRGAVALGTALAALAVAVPSARAVDPAPFTLTTISAEAGYFEVTGTCPKSTAKLRFSWNPSPSGPGWGEITVKPLVPFTLRLRMQASAPGETIAVTLQCRSAGGKTRFTFGPVDTVSGNELLPEPPDGGSGRRIVYSLSAQQLWAMAEDGTVARTYLVSGRRLALISFSTQLGAFEVFSKSKMGCVNGIRCPFMVRFNRTKLNNLGFHAIPWSKPKGFWQKPDELGQPRSGGCVRADPVNAEWLFNWAVKGDKVFVVE